MARPAASAVPLIALGVGVGTFAMFFWLPFVPLYLKELGATTDADALAWSSVALTGLGISRLVVAPVWGLLSDRFGRKVMFVRALVFASATTLIAAAATEPWHVAVAFTSQGLFSGFVPASTALTSVLAPESKLGTSLGIVNGAQYLGTTLGPLVGAVLAAAFGLRGAILVAGILPAVVAVLVLLLVPSDRVVPRRIDPIDGVEDGVPRPGRRLHQSLSELTTVPVRIGLILLFLAFATGQALRLAVPLLIAGMVGASEVEGVVGIAFTLGGLASVVGVAVAGRRLARAGVLVRGLTVASAVAAASYLLLAAVGSAAAFIAAFTLVSMAQAAMLPGTNTVIATSVRRERRGTVFGLAATAQALASMVGSIAAAAFATLSLQLGFVLMAVIYVVLAVLLPRGLIEPRRSDPDDDSAEEAASPEATPI